MSREILVFLVTILAAGMGLAFDPPVMDGVITPGEWDDFKMDRLISDWPFGDQNEHTAVDVYFTHDDDYFYVAYEADPTSDGWVQSCAEMAPGVHRLGVCGDPEAHPDDEGCNDPYPCTTPASQVLLWMEGEEPLVSFNTEFCIFGAPVPFSSVGIQHGYAGPSTRCDPNHPEYLHFVTELKVPKSTLLGEDSIQIGGWQWQDVLTWAYEDRDGDGVDDCSCTEGASLVLPVTVDIKPSNVHNCLNLDSEGLIKVAILATDDFDPVNNGTGAFCRSITFLGVTADRCRVKDVNGDAREDLLALYRGRRLLREGEIDCNSTTTVVRGLTFEGTAIAGEDRICYLGNVCK